MKNHIEYPQHRGPDGRRIILLFLVALALVVIIGAGYYLTAL